MVIERARYEDLDEIQEIYKWARDFMRRTGNPNQWKDNKPILGDLENDIEKGDLYLVKNEGLLVGAFALIIGEDPTYKVVYGGRWLNDEPYGTIHRIAANGKAKGVFEEAIRFALTKTRNVRIDTHEDNKVMQAKLEKAGFVYCGIIHLMNGDERLAYHLSK